MTKKKPYIRLRPRLDLAGEGYPLPMRGLLTLGKPKEDTPYGEWAERLRNYVPQLIQMTLDDDLNSRPEKDRAVWAPLHALEILAELAPVEAVEPLMEVLEWDDDWSTDPLLQFFGRVGGVAAPALKQRALDASLPETTRGRAIAGLEAIAQENPDTRDDIVGFLIDYLDQGSSDTLEEEYVVTTAILSLTDLRAVEALSAIERAFEQDRVQTFMVSLDDVKRAFDLAPETSGEDEGSQRGVTLSLKCLSCGRDREYTFERAYFDVSVVEHHDSGAMSRAIYVPEPVVCKRCGAVDQYELGSHGSLLMTAMLMAAMSGQPNPFPDLKLAHFPPAPWGWLSPRDALARYRAEVAAHPDDVELRIEYGDVLVEVGQYDAALEQYERALLMDPTAGDALFGIAAIKGKHGEISEAVLAWEQMERDFDKLRFPKIKNEDRKHIPRMVAHTLAELRSGKRPSFRPEEEAKLTTDAQLEDEPSDSETPLPPQEAYREVEPVRPETGSFGKVGRNERCPCGSGKKYKQCHGRK